MPNLDIFKHYEKPQRGSRFKKDLIELRGAECEQCKNSV